MVFIMASSWGLIGIVIPPPPFTIPLSRECLVVILGFTFHPMIVIPLLSLPSPGKPFLCHGRRVLPAPSLSPYKGFSRFLFFFLATGENVPLGGRSWARSRPRIAAFSFPHGQFPSKFSHSFSSTGRGRRFLAFFFWLIRPVSAPPSSVFPFLSSPAAEYPHDYFQAPLTIVQGNTAPPFCYVYEVPFPKSPPPGPSLGSED